MSLSEIEPQHNQRVMDLVREAGIDVTDWSNFKGGSAKAASNPRYCYEWSFMNDNIIVLNLWFDQLFFKNEKIYREINMRALSKKYSKPIWKKRARRMDNAIRRAYESQIPVRVIVGSRTRSASDDQNQEPSKTTKRLLDTVEWAVATYDITTGNSVIERGLIPAIPLDELQLLDQNEIEFAEGKLKERLIKHRKRESRLRRMKIDEALHKHSGHLICEVPNCNFDFLKTYGPIGEGYAQVHHKIPLNEAPPEGRNATLEDLAIVCANCHVMIHRNGECLPMETLIPVKRRRNIS